MADQENEMEKIEKRLSSLEIRLARLESSYVTPGSENLKSSAEQFQTAGPSGVAEQLTEEEKGLESQIGRFGLAWLGNIVLLFGIIFMTQYLIIKGLPGLATAAGYVSAVSIILLAGYLRKINGPLSFTFKLNAQILLYYITLRLHFFSQAPVLPNRTVSVIFLMCLVAMQVYISIRDRSQTFAALAIIFILVTGISCDTKYITLPLLILAAGGSVYYYTTFKWKSLLVFTIVLVYGAFLLWLLGNPFLGHHLQLITQKNAGVLYLFALGAGFSVVLLFRPYDGSSDEFLIGIIVLNGILFTILLTFVVLGFYSNKYVALFSIISACCLVYSIILHYRSGWNFALAFYALYGFMAMSIALSGLFGLPRVYLLLSVQSLVVVSMALWFRNRLIIVMNSVLFLTILLVYFLSSKYVNSVNISFALVPLISARVINWKKSRLQIKTDLIRNLYMIEGFFMVLFALGHAVPKQFITLSWTISALMYFLIGYILKNVKYRYMALGTMICAAFYLFIFDLSRIEIIYRVLALLFLAAISIGISIYYTNRIKKPDN